MGKNQLSYEVIAELDTEERDVYHLQTTEDAKTDEVDRPRPLSSRGRVAIARQRTRRKVADGAYAVKRGISRASGLFASLSSTVEDVIARIIFRRGFARLSQDERIALERAKSVVAALCVFSTLVLFLMFIELVNYVLLAL